MLSQNLDQEQTSLPTEGEALGVSPVQWGALSQAYHRLTQAFIAQPAVPPVDELDAFAALAIRSRLSPHELVALHYATLNQLLAGDERYAESSGAARRALVSVLLRLMGEYQRSACGVAPRLGGR